MKRNTLASLVLVAPALCGGSLARAQQDPCSPREILLSAATNRNVNQILEWDPDGDGPERPLLVHGSINSTPSNSLVAWDGLNEMSLGDATWWYVYGIGIWQGKLVVNGGMTLPGQPAVNAIAVFDGVMWQTLESPAAQCWPEVLIDFRGDLVAGGWFGDTDGHFLAGVMRFNGAEWEPLGGGINGSAAGACLLGDDLVLGGSFTSAGGVETGGLAAWNGKTWRPVADPAPGGISSLAALDGVLYTIEYNDEYSFFFARSWDGSAWADMPLPDELGWYQLTQLRAINGELYALGNYLCFGGGGGVPGGPFCGLVAPVLVRWNESGWDLLNASWYARSYTALAGYGPEVILGRTRGSRYDPDVSSVSRFLASGAPWFVDQPRDAAVDAGNSVTLTAATVSGYDADGPIAYQWLRNQRPITDGPGGASPAGGSVAGASGTFNTSFSTSFTITGVQPSDTGEYRCVLTNSCGMVESAAAVVTIEPVCRADFNHDGLVNSTDVSSFINAWFADQACGTLKADWDLDGVVNSTDVSEFINAWFNDLAAGCG